MSNKKTIQHGFQYLVVVHFQLDGEELSEEDPSGKVYLSGCYEMCDGGEQEFKKTLEAFFEKVTVVFADLAQKLAGSKLANS